MDKLIHSRHRELLAAETAVSGCRVRSRESMTGWVGVDVVLGFEASNAASSGAAAIASCTAFFTFSRDVSQHKPKAKVWAPLRVCVAIAGTIGRWRLFCWIGRLCVTRHYDPTPRPLHRASIKRFLLLAARGFLVCRSYADLAPTGHRPRWAERPVRRPCSDRPVLVEIRGFRSRNSTV